MKNILIAEDEKPLSNALKIKLSQANFEVEVASNGIEVMDKLKSNKYDYILLDLMMPGHNGFDILDFIKQNNIKSKVVVASNLSQQSDKEKVLQMGALKYLVKSDVSISEIVREIESL